LSLSTEVLAFCALLREERGIDLGGAEVQDALRAVEAVGVDSAARFRCALRVVCCAKQEDIPEFERAFDAFFLAPRRGTRQHAYRPRESRSGPAPRPPRESTGGQLREVRSSDASDASTWETLLARYSAAPGRAGAPAISQDGLAEMLRAASHLVAEARLGRSRRWRPQERGERFDLRHTLRASLRTGGDPVFLRRLGHPRRNPRFVLLIDGSRSMAEHGATMLQFAYALAARSRRTAVFLFSTELRDVTRDLRRVRIPHLAGLGDAWGGGTRIGANLLAFVRGAGRRLLSDDTIAIVISDGLEGDDVERLRLAMREMRRRSAAIVWVNPHAGARGFTPSSRAMQAALPYITRLSGATDARSLAGLIHRLHARGGAGPSGTSPGGWFE
jgi:uncharacterized protein with von Willebrand factor type A (vWA) domain